jgi:hypothetical protein
MNSHEQPSMARDAGMRALLRDMPAGVPADCLLARIRGRRSFLVRDWDRLLARQPSAALPPAPWRWTISGAEGWALESLQQECFWVFSRMDEQLRRVMAPFFWLAELRTLAVCLRFLTGEGMVSDGLLKRSLLSNSIRGLLRKAVGCAEAAAGLEDLLAGYGPCYAGLADSYRTGGTGALEAALYEKSLQCMSRSPAHPQMRCYIALVIDGRNLTTLAKRLRWRLSTIPPLLEGGSLPPSRLAALFRRRDSAGLLQLAMRLGGVVTYSETDDLERVLFTSQSRVMRRMARGAEGVGVILDYLWRCGNEAVNIGLLERLETMGSKQAEAELRR